MGGTSPAAPCFRAGFPPAGALLHAFCASRFRTLNRWPCVSDAAQVMGLRMLVDDAKYVAGPDGDCEGLALAEAVNTHLPPQIRVFTVQKASGGRGGMGHGAWVWWRWFRWRGGGGEAVAARARAAMRTGCGNAHAPVVQCGLPTRYVLCAFVGATDI